MKVFEETRALSVKFANNDIKGRPVAVTWEHSLDREICGTVSFEYLVDATGRDGFMAQKYIKHRKVNSSLRNVACWGYWKGAGVYGIGTSRENAAWFEALTGTFPLIADARVIGIIYPFDRRIWLELVHSVAQRNNLRGCCHERECLEHAQRSHQACERSCFPHS